MEMQKAALLASLWEKSHEDFRTEIFARLSVESVYNYRMTCKQLNEFLCSNYFLRKWAEVQAPLNSEQSRLVLLNKNPKLPSASFCFYTRTWIKSSVGLPFIEECCTMCTKKSVNCRESAAGVMFIGASGDCKRRMCGRLCNPYTQTFIDIPAPQSRRHSHCMVVNKERRGTSYKAKVIAIGEAFDANGVLERHMIEIYEPSQKKWNIAGYFPEDLRLRLFAELVFYNGSFYTYAYRQKDIVCFTIPLDENGLAVAPNPITIPVHFVPLPEIVQNTNEFLLSSPQIIKCGSRLLLVGDKMPTRVEKVGGEGEGDVVMKMQEGVIILWELNSTEECNEWVEIAQMPSFLFREWTSQQFIDHEFDLIHNWKILESFLWRCCIAVGDQVCFVPGLVISLPSPSPSPVVKVVVYHLSDNTWDCLPHCPKSFFFAEGQDDATYNILYKAITLEPSPHIQVK